jgi:hypothetical protein
MTTIEMILQLRQSGMSSADISRWGRKRGRQFTASAINMIVARESKRVSDSIRLTVEDLYNRLCA